MPSVESSGVAVLKYAPCHPPASCSRVRPTSARARPAAALRYSSTRVDCGLAIVGLTLLLLAAVSQRLVSTPITSAMVVVAVGVLVGPQVLDDLTLGPTSSTVRRLAEATLAVVLFSDSSRINLRDLRREASLPGRLLGIGLPLTIVLGTLVALVLFGSFSLSEALILGVILAPTDAGLGSAALGGSGFIAAFVAGTLFGFCSALSPARPRLGGCASRRRPRRCWTASRYSYSARCS